jgi:hypothetical protein
MCLGKKFLFTERSLDTGQPSVWVKRRRCERFTASGAFGEHGVMKGQLHRACSCMLVAMSAGCMYCEKEAELRKTTVSKLEM